MARISRLFTFVFACVLSAGGVGCSTGPRSEADVFDNLTLLSGKFTEATEPAVSPDGRWLAFRGTEPGEATAALYVAPLSEQAGRLSLGQPVRVTPPGVEGLSAAFSPDGQAIVLALAVREGLRVEARRPGRDVVAGQLHIAEGWQGALAAVEPGRGVDLTGRRLPLEGMGAISPAFSPVDKNLAFTTRQGEGASPQAPQAGVAVLHADGTITRLTDEGRYADRFSPGPGGFRVAYTQGEPWKGLLRVMVATAAYDPDGRLVKLLQVGELPGPAAVQFAPAWHPLGEHLLYASSEKGFDNYELFVASLGTDRRIRLTFTGGYDGLGLFTPDGRHVVWVSQRGPPDAAGKPVNRLYAARFIWPLVKQPKATQGNG
ncbi:MAG: TolB family protein [Phycisphaerae bacterium]